MPADTPRNPRRWVQFRPPDLAALMMARAMAEMYRDEPDRPLPAPLAPPPAADGALEEGTGKA
jgi:hypothetical protein